MGRSEAREWSEDDTISPARTVETDRSRALTDDAAWGRAEREGDRYATSVRSPDADSNLSRKDHSAESHGRVELASLPIVGELRPVQGDHSNEVFIVRLANGSDAFLKPESGERPDLRLDGIPNKSEWKREVAACDVDRAIGFGLVPDTVARDESERGIGNASLQRAAPNEGLPYEAYSEKDRQEMAVLDYLLANTDRHHGNYLTSSEGRPAAIDNGLSLPENDNDGIRSQWVADQLDQSLNPELISDLQRVDEISLINKLRVDGISSEAIRGLRNRLHEVQRGQITGEAWRGEIYGGDYSWNLIRGRL
jgi:hypothetical protein